MMPRDDAIYNGGMMRLSGLKLARGGKTILDIDALEFPTGATTVFIGPNGGGKTTLLRVLHGLVAPDAGKIEWNGGSVPTQAMLLQNPVLLRRSVAGNLAFALKRAGVPRAQHAERIKELLAEAGLDGMEAVPARRLSGGQQRRLALARALAIDPSMLLLDEPASGLDPTAMRRLESMIVAIDMSGISVVLSSHDLGQVKRLADHLVFLHHGKVVESGPADRLLDNPGSDELRAFLRGDLLW